MTKVQYLELDSLSIEKAEDGTQRYTWYSLEGVKRILEGR